MFSVHASGRQRGAPAVAGALVALVLLTGCQGEADPPASQPSAPAVPSAEAVVTEAPASPSVSPSAAPSPASPASSLGPAANLPVPVKPALADENSAEGLEAFTEYWFELFSYGYETNDWAPFEEVTDPGCGTCANVMTAVGKVFDSGGWIAGGRTEVTDFSTDFAVNTQGSINAIVLVEQGASQVYLKSGEIESDDPESDPTANVIFVVFDNGQWRMLDFGAPEGTG